MNFPHALDLPGAKTRAWITLLVLGLAVALFTAAVCGVAGSTH